MATTATAQKPRKKSVSAQPPPAVWAPAIVLYVVFSFFIVLAARGNLWLDEIWSVDFARGAHSLRDLFTLFRHDNNHPLNTMYQYLVRQQSGLFSWRVWSTDFPRRERPARSWLKDCAAFQICRGTSAPC